MLQFVAACANRKDSEDHRELAFVILGELTETIGDVLQAHFASLKVLFQQVRYNPTAAVGLVTVRSRASGNACCVTGTALIGVYVELTAQLEAAGGVSTLFDCMPGPVI